MKMTVEEIATRAGALAKVLVFEPTLVGRSLRELAVLIEALASQPRAALRKRK